MSAITAELLMIAITLVTGVGSWYLWQSERRWLSAALFVAGITACVMIADHWDIKVNSFLTRDSKGRHPNSKTARYATYALQPSADVGN